MKTGLGGGTLCMQARQGKDAGKGGCSRERCVGYEEELRLEQLWTSGEYSAKACSGCY